MFQELSGPTNGLIILSSVSLAITQFFYQDLKTRFADGKASLEQIFDDIPSLMKEPMRQQLDNIINNTAISSLRPQMGCLFLILVACGLLKSAQMGAPWIFQLNLIPSFETVTLAILSLVCTCLLGWIGFAIYRMGDRIKSMETQIDAFRKQAKVVNDTMSRLPNSTGVRPAFVTVPSDR